MRLCQDYGITDASAFLLERVGDVEGAFMITVDGLNIKFEKLASSIQSEVSKLIKTGSIDIDHLNTIMQTNEVYEIKFDAFEIFMQCEYVMKKFQLSFMQFIMVRGVLHALIGLCQRNTERLEPRESESLWLRLLDM